GSGEISGGRLSGRGAPTGKGGGLRAEVPPHFADGANHARSWTDCVTDLGGEPIKLRDAYQDRYLEAAGPPVNLMEVMAVTQVFEKRVIGQYRQHLLVPDLHPRIRQTLEQIMVDERRHIKYVRDALQEVESRYGAEPTGAALDRFTGADEEVYAWTLAEQGERVAFLHGRESGGEPV